MQHGNIDIPMARDSGLLLCGRVTQYAAASQPKSTITNTDKATNTLFWSVIAPKCLGAPPPDRNTLS